MGERKPKNPNGMIIKMYSYYVFHRSTKPDFRTETLPKPILASFGDIDELLGISVIDFGLPQVNSGF